MIHDVIERWHSYIRGEGGDLDELLHPDCVFLSPVVFTPQEGREITKAYLQAAGSVFGGDDTSGDAAGGDGDDKKGDKKFAYRREVIDGNHAVLEFETTMGGKYVNGVDMITCDDDGLITEFKVMLRPLQAVNLVHQLMGAQLDANN